MKRILPLLTLGLLILTSNFVSAQAPTKIPYQAVLRTPAGEILANQPALVKASVILNEPTENPVFSETHSVVSNPFGIISLTLGNGVPVLGSIDEINWKSGVAFLKIEIDYQNSGNYLLLGVSQILSVPFALQSGNSLNQLPGQQGQIISHDGSDWQAYDKVWVNPGVVTVDGAPTKSPEDPIFQIKNLAGETLFNVTHQGVSINLPDDGSANGALQVHGLSTGNQYLFLNPDSAQLQFNSDVPRAEKGGFAVGGLSSGKVISTPYFMLMPESAQLNFDKAAAIKAEKGGFAVGGLSSGKLVSTIFTIEQDCTRMYLESDLERAEKGGFAVGGLSSGKLLGQEYFRLSSVGAQVLFDEEAVRAEKGGFAVGGLSSGKTVARDYLNLSQEQVKFSMAERDERSGLGGFTIGGYMNNGEEYYSFFNLTPFTVTINTGSVTTGGINVGGDINVGGNIIFLPQVSTDFVAEYDSLNATVYGTLVADGGGAVTSYGLVWGTQPLPTPTQNTGICTIETVEFAQFMCQLTNLNFSTTYYVRAFAINSAGTAYGDEFSFTTFSQTAIMPKALTLSSSNISDISAMAHGEILNPADSSYMSKGFVYNTTGSPTLLNNSQIVFDEIQSNGMFSMLLVNLNPSTTYYFRAFVMHSEGVGYGEVLSFTTLPSPTITAPVVNPVFDVYAFATSTVINEPLTNVTSAGFIWSTSADVNMGNYLHITTHLAATGEITDSIGGLDPNMDYFIRSYVIHSSGTYMSNAQFFTTKESPSIFTNSALAISDTEIEANATIITNDCQVIASGFVWDKIDNPELENNPLGLTRILFDENLNFSALIENLLPDSTYYVRAYVEHLNGNSYGLSLPVTLLPSPTVITYPVSGITNFSAFVSGKLTATTGVPYDSVGFMWSMSSNVNEGNFFGYSTQTTDENGNFSSEITGLEAGVNWYVRAYVHHSQGFSYANEESFTTSVNPTIVTNPVTDLTDLSAKLHATVFVTANISVLDLGFEYTETTFTAGEMTTISLFASWMNETEISHPLTGLVPGTVYQVRAFVQHNNGTSYGTAMNFTTYFTPLVSTASVLDITDISAAANGILSMDEELALLDIGFDLSETDFQDVFRRESILTDYNENGNFTYQYLDLTPGTMYKVRAYIQYVNGFLLADSVTFTTSIPPSITTDSVVSVIDVSAVAYARITQPQGTAITDLGFEYTETDFGGTVIPVSVFASWEGEEILSANLETLSPGTEYKVRAYVLHSTGTSYGEILNFITLVKPTVTTDSINIITDISAVAHATLTQPLGVTITDFGFEYTETNFEGTVIPVSAISGWEGQNEFYSTLDMLNPGTEYQVRAFVTYSFGTSYGDILSFTTLPSLITTDSVDQITDISAQAYATLNQEPGMAILDVGFTFMKADSTGGPTFIGLFSEWGGEDSFSGTLHGLQANTTYNVKSFVTYETGSSYGNVLTFTTLAAPTVSMDSVTDIFSNQAIGHATISLNSSLITECGFVWSESGIPHLENNNVGSFTKIFDGQLVYSDQITSLLANNQYAVSAFIKYGTDTIYSTPLEFLSKPEIVLNSIFNIAQYSATAGATVFSSETILECGIVWSQSENPHLDDNNEGYHIEDFEGTPGESYFHELWDLEISTQYYIKAFIVTNETVYYSNQLSFTTLDPLNVVMDSIANITRIGATVHAKVNLNGSTVLRTGFAWAQWENPVVSDNRLDWPFSSAQFSHQLYLYEPGVTHFVRPYVVQTDSSILYGNQMSFTTLPLEVETSPEPHIFANGAILSGKILDWNMLTGQSAMGFVWATHNNPTRNNNEGMTETSSITFNPYFEEISELTPETDYYYRMYFKFSDSVFYGNVVQFTTKPIFGTMVDIDGNAYPTKFIGNLNWSIQNLRTTRYANSALINPGRVSSVWDTVVSTDTAAVFGKYYHSDAAFNHFKPGKLTEKVCPTGWRLPLYSDYENLIDIGSAPESAEQLKDTAYNMWDPELLPPTNQTGFAALALGKWFFNGGQWMVNNFNGNLAYFWAESPASQKSDFEIFGEELNINSIYFSDSSFATIRCVQNFEVLPRIQSSIYNEDLSNATLKINYTVESTGYAENGKQGILWSTEQWPTLENAQGFSEHDLRSGNTTDHYNQPLPFGQWLFVRAYAQNTKGTVYSQQIWVMLTEPSFTLETFPITQISPTGLTAFGRIIEMSSLHLDSVGFVLASFDNPTLETAQKIAGVSSPVDDIFQSEFFGLDNAVTYFVRPYGKVGGFVRYGETTIVNLPEMSGTLIDIDLNEYPTRYIGKQNWMTQNLRVLNYSNGDAIGIEEHVLPFWGEDSLIRHGRLYSELVASNHKINAPNAHICPTGWRLPKMEDWYELFQNAAPYEWLAARYLRSNNGWAEDIICNDSVGFSALPTGEYYIYNEYGYSEEEFYGAYSEAYFWTEPNIENTHISSNIVTISERNDQPNYNYWDWNIGGDWKDYISIRCLQNKVSLPAFEFASLTDTTHNAFRVEYYVISTGNSTTGTQGVIWGTSPDLTITQYEGKTTNPLKNEGFAENVTGIIQGVTYYARVYFSNEAGTIYSPVFEFVASQSQTMLDVQGNKYPIVTIGTQEWMARNLRTTRFSNRKDIDENQLTQFYSPEWGFGNVETSGFFYCINSIANHLTDGIQASLCPTGWRLPEPADWATLYATVGGDIDTVGRHLKALDAGWPLATPTNSTGFSAIPTGYIGLDFEFSPPESISIDYGNKAYFWGEPIENSFGFESVVNILNGDDDNVQTLSYNSGNSEQESAYYPVRCLKSIEQVPELGTTFETESTANSLAVKFTVRHSGYEVSGTQGIVVSTEPNPTIEMNEKMSVSPIRSGQNVAFVDGLIPSTQYHVKVYVKNKLGTEYSNEMIINTGTIPGIFDIQGNKYKTVTIANQEWMAQNLRTPKYKSREFLPYVGLPQQGTDSVIEYGLFYDIASITKSFNGNRSICPSGWRLPKSEDWMLLKDEAGGDAVNAAGHLQDAIIAWPLGNSTDSLGFSATPSGFGIGDESGGGGHGGGFAPGQPTKAPEQMQSYEGVGQKTVFWSEPEFVDDWFSSSTFIIDGIENRLSLTEYTHDGNNPNIFAPIRCVKEGSIPPYIKANVEYNSVESEIWVKFNIASAGFSRNGTKGIVWSTNPSPTLETNEGILSEPISKGETGYVITNLSPTTTYYVVPYASNEAGISYAPQVTVSTNDQQGLFDREGNIYEYVPIEGQDWMKQNLRSTRYANWSEISSEDYFPPYEEDPLEEYGMYYDQDAITKNRTNPNQTLCPAGWRMPDGFDWNSLISAAGGDEGTAGETLKDAEAPWVDGGINATGFSAYPAGFYAEMYGEGWSPAHIYTGEKSFFWFSPIGSSPEIMYQFFKIHGDSDSVFAEVFEAPEFGDIRNISYSVRCIRAVYNAPELINPSIFRHNHQSITVRYEIPVSGFRPEGKRGIVWSKNPNPTLQSNQGKIATFLERGVFEQIVGDLQENTTYYLRMYATNDLGTVYSDELVVTTDENKVIYDYNGIPYQTKKIGNQEWMLRNLQTTRYNNGDQIHQQENSGYPEDPYYTQYPTPGSKAYNFGKLYAYDIINDPRGICPAGWKIPAREDWQELFTTIGGMGVAGGKLKSTDTEPESEEIGDGYWLFPNSGATDSYYFDAKPAGYHSYSGYFYGINSVEPMQARFWSNTLSGANNAFVYFMTHDSPEVFETTESITGDTYWSAYSVRCVKKTTKFSGGTGVDVDPYIITSLADLAELAQSPETWDKHFEQTQDIDAGETNTWHDGEGWLPIGNMTKQFTGVFNGNGKTVANLFINRVTNYQGFFGNCVGATISNLGIVNVNFTTGAMSGALSGDIYANTQIVQCYSTGTVSATSHSGGLVGYTGMSQVRKSYSTVNISGSMYDIGGLVGKIDFSSVVENCYATGNVNAPNIVGGLVGRNESSTISNSYSMGMVSQNGSYGGLVGINNGTLTNSFWNMETSEISTSGAGIGLTNNQLGRKRDFFDWDFENTWQIEKYVTYPYLKWQEAPGEHNQPNEFPFAYVVDYDGNKYGILFIGDQQWLDENLRTTSYWDSDPIPFVSPNADPLNDDVFGKLYSFNDIDMKNPCPTEFGIPAHFDWKELEIYLGMDPGILDDFNWRGTNEGGRLKEKTILYWNNPNNLATDELGFTALPAGYTDDTNSPINFGTEAHFWTRSVHDTNNAIYRVLSNTEGAIYNQFGPKTHYRSVRCIWVGN
jgi:uncharacterized protein (TIGR02145 family)